MEDSIINKKVYWNTGAKYTEHGQRMGAFWDGKYIHWTDIDRGLCGAVESGAVFNKHYLQEVAQFAYDHYLGKGYSQLGTEEQMKFDKEVEDNAPSNKKEVR
jgi:hypothetical protein